MKFGNDLHELDDSKVVFSWGCHLFLVEDSPLSRMIFRRRITVGSDYRDDFQTLDTTGSDCRGWLADAGYYRARSLKGVTPRSWILQVLFVGF